jgi:hypothetical protein
MNDFLIGIEYDAATRTFVACYSNCINIPLAASTYEDAVLEADMIEPYEYVD